MSSIHRSKIVSSIFNDIADPRSAWNRQHLIEECIIPIDAMGCQKKIAEQIIAQKADYILAVKENQGALYGAIHALFQQAKALNFQQMVYDYSEEIDAGHGRIETRQCTVLPLMYLRPFKLKWRGLQSLVLIQSQREINDTIQTEQRYYISSLPLHAHLIMNAIRQHSSIENQLHWVLDVVFQEDGSRIRKDFGIPFKSNFKICLCFLNIF